MASGLRGRCAGLGQRGDGGQPGAAPIAVDDRRRLALDHEGAGEERRRPAPAEPARSRRSASTRRRQPVRVDALEVGRDPVAGLQQHQVADDELGGVDSAGAPSRTDGRPGAGAGRAARSAARSARYSCTNAKRPLMTTTTTIATRELRHARRRRPSTAATHSSEGEEVHQLSHEQPQRRRRPSTGRRLPPGGRRRAASAELRPAGRASSRAATRGGPAGGSQALPVIGRRGPSAARRRRPRPSLDPWSPWQGS